MPFLDTASLMCHRLSEYRKKRNERHEMPQARSAVLTVSPDPLAAPSTRPTPRVLDPGRALKVHRIQIRDEKWPATSSRQTRRWSYARSLDSAVKRGGSRRAGKTLVPTERSSGGDSVLPRQPCRHQVPLCTMMFQAATIIPYLSHAGANMVCLLRKLESLSGRAFAGVRVRQELP